MSNATSDRKSRPKLATVVALDGLGESALLALAASTFSGFETPLAAAILESQQARVVLGDARRFAELGISIEGLSDWPDRLKRYGQQPLFIAVDGRTVGFLGVTSVMEDENA